MSHSSFKLTEEIFKLPIPEHHLDAWYFKPEYAESYEAFYKGKYKEADVLEKEALVTMLGKFDSITSIVDVGCGTGHFTRWYESLGYRTIGMDISPVMLSVARTLWNGPLCNAASDRLPLKDRSFDLVSMIACTEYMPDLRRVLREARRIARRGIIIGIMNRWSLPTFRRLIQRRFGKNPFYTNATFRSSRRIRDVAREAFSDEPFEFFWVATLFPKFLNFPKMLKGAMIARFPLGAFVAIAIKFD